MGFVVRVVTRINAHHDTGVGIALIARILAHAVGHHPLGFAGGCHHGASRAHAKAIHTATVVRVVNQFVVGSA